MTGKPIVRALSALALAVLLGSSLAVASEIPQPSPAPQPEMTAPLPAALTAPAGEACSGGEESFLGITEVRECTGCSFEPLSFCTSCCGRQAFCIDTMDGGYCTC